MLSAARKPFFYYIHVLAFKLQRQLSTNTRKFLENKKNLEALSNICELLYGRLYVFILAPEWMFYSTRGKIRGAYQTAPLCWSRSKQ